VVFPFRGILAAPNDLLIEGGSSTAMLAWAVPPVPPSSDVTLPVILFCAPAAVPVTFTLTVQEPLAGMVAPARLTLLDPDAAVAVPTVQEVATPLGLATAIPAGSVSVKPTAVSGMVLMAGFAIVNVRLVFPFRGTEGPPKALVMVGGAITVTLAADVPPVPPSVDVTGPAVLACAPGTVPVTLTLKVHDAPPLRLPFASVMALPPGAAVIVPPPQVPVIGFGDTISPAGSVSVNATLLSDWLAFGFVIVKLSGVAPFNGIVAAPNDVVRVAGSVTLRLADAVFPLPPLADVTLVVLVKVPPAVPVTLMVKVHEPLPAKVAPDKLTLVAPGFAVTVLPLHELLGAGELATAIPAGKVSVNPTPVSAKEFAAGFVSVKVSVVFVFSGILDAPNDLLMEGGASTVMPADAVRPLPPSTDTTAPVVLVCAPVVALVIFTANVHAPLTVMVPPARLTLFDPGAAVIVPGLQLPVKPFEVATTMPGGNVSVKPTPVSGTVFAAGLESVKVKVAVPFWGMVGAPNALAIVGGIATAIEALLPAPAEVSFAEISPVLVDCVPAAKPVTLTENVQKPFPASVAPARLTTLVPPVAVMVPVPHVPFSPLDADIASPAGSVSVNAIPLRVSFTLGLLTVKKSWVMPLIGTVVAANPMLTLGGDVMPRFADAVLPVPPFVDVTAPVVLATSMGSVPRTFTLNVQELFAANVAPDKLTEFAPGTAPIVPPPHDPV